MHSIKTDRQYKNGKSEKWIGNNNWRFVFGNCWRKELHWPYNDKHEDKDKVKPIHGGSGVSRTFLRMWDQTNWSGEAVRLLSVQAACSWMVQCRTTQTIRGLPRWGKLLKEETALGTGKWSLFVRENALSDCWWFYCLLLYCQTVVLHIAMFFELFCCCFHTNNKSG